jgi:hypothetical protein
MPCPACNTLRKGLRRMALEPRPIRTAGGTEIGTELDDCLSDLDLQQAIELRWTLRDIKAERWVLSPVNPAHLQTLIAMGLAEIRNDHLVLTNSGLDEFHKMRHSRRRITSALRCRLALTISDGRALRLRPLN